MAQISCTPPQLDTGRCLRNRCRSFQCSRCVDACPLRALSLNGNFTVNREACTGCMLCVAACPVEALDPGGVSFHEAAARLSSDEYPVLGCRRMSDIPAHLRVSCLGQFSEEHFAALAGLLPGGLQLNACRCGKCAAGDSLPAMKAKLAHLANVGLEDLADRIHVVEEETALIHNSRSVTRREFFHYLRRDTLNGIQSVVPRPDSDKGAVRSRKRLPSGRSLLLSAYRETPNALLFRLRVADSCDGCPKCAAMCPTGALLRSRGEEGYSLHFDPSRCVGCGVCAHFCPSQSLHVKSANGQGQAART